MLVRKVAEGRKRGLMHYPFIASIDKRAHKQAGGKQTPNRLPGTHSLNGP